MPRRDEMPRHGLAHDAETDESELRHVAPPHYNDQEASCSNPEIAAQPPFEPCRPFGRNVLRAHPPAIADPVDPAEEPGEVHLARARLVPVGHVGELDVPDVVELRLDRLRQVAFHDLHVEDVVLDLEVVGADLSDDVERLRGRVQVEAGDRAGVDRLHHERDARLARGLGRVAQVLDEGREHLVGIGILGRDAGEAVQPRDAEDARVLERLGDAVAELGHPVGMARDAALALVPVAGREVEEHDLDARVARRALEVRVLPGVREVELDAPEPGLPRRVEALEKLDLGEEEARVRGELRHGCGPSEGAMLGRGTAGAAGASRPPPTMNTPTASEATMNRESSRTSGTTSSAPRTRRQHRAG